MENSVVTQIRSVNGTKQFSHYTVTWTFGEAVRLLFINYPDTYRYSKCNAGERKMHVLELIERYKKIRVADVVDALDRYGFHDRVLVSNEIKHTMLQR